MPDFLLYQEDAYVLLETNQPEQFLSAQELLLKLTDILRSRPDDLPRELRKFSTIEEQARHLRDNYCELDQEPGQYLQWYVVRLEK
jgi:hypothetical protein